MKNSISYNGTEIFLTTKHMKSVAIAPPFRNILGATIIENVVDTDLLGTFSGEIERQGSALDCVRKKCEWTLDIFKTKIDYVLASEGSFGPHPAYHFLPCDYEILYFIDRNHDFHFYLSDSSLETNYRVETINSLDDLMKFSLLAKFPSHALIIKSNEPKANCCPIKGIQNSCELELAFCTAQKNSKNSTVTVETDMRANYNPSRMKFIGELAQKFAERLNSFCPCCGIPGWGKVRSSKGLPCSLCYLATTMISNEIWVCVKCGFEEIYPRSDNLQYADPQYCQFCNP